MQRYEAVCGIVSGFREELCKEIRKVHLRSYRSFPRFLPPSGPHLIFRGRQSLTPMRL